MTVASTQSRNDYTGNGATNTYTYVFKIFANTELLVTVADTSGVETQLTLTTDYTVTGVGETAGGTIVLVNAGQAWLTGGNLTSGWSLTIRRTPPLTQATDIRNQGSFYPEAHENQFDKHCMVDQKQQDEIDRCIKLPETEAGSAAATIIPDATTRASKLFGWDASGNPIATSTLSGVGSGLPFVMIGNDATVSAERALTGTANQVIITDNGANSTVVLSTPQDIATTSNVEFLSTQYGAGSGVAVSAASKARIRYNESSNEIQVSLNGGGYVNMLGGAGSGDLDDAYNNGSVITCDAGAVQITASGTPGTYSQLILDGTMTVPSGAAATWRSANFDTDVTITGSTNITTALGFNHVEVQAPTLSAASALAVTNAATFFIGGPPAGGGAGPAAITNAYALWVQSGYIRLGGKTFIGVVAPSSTENFHTTGAAIVEDSLFVGTSTFAHTNLLAYGTGSRSSFNSIDENVRFYNSAAAARSVVIDNDSASGSAIQDLYVITNTTAGAGVGGAKYIQLRVDTSNCSVQCQPSAGGAVRFGTKGNAGHNGSGNMEFYVFSNDAWTQDDIVLKLWGTTASGVIKNVTIGDTTGYAAASWDNQKLNVIRSAGNQIRIWQATNRYSTLHATATALAIESVISAGTFTYTFPQTTGYLVVQGTSPPMTNGDFSGYVEIGANPAQSGALRINNDATINARNAANLADIEMIRVNTSDEVAVATAAGTDVQLGNATGKIGFFATTPVVRTAAYTPTNVTPDRSYNADSTSTAELADVLGTVIADLQSYGLLQ
jgi:hypothetical protein